MAVHTSTLAANSLTFPAKIKSSNHLLSSLSIPSFSTPFRNPSFAISFPDPIRVTAQQKYTYPDPGPEFAEAFRDELMKKLMKDKGEFGDQLYNVANVCAELWGVTFESWGSYMSIIRDYTKITKE